MLVVEYGNSIEDVLDENIAGIDADEIGPASEVCRNVFVEEIQGSNGDGEKQSRL